jgi:hypothetical protein
MSRVVLQDFGSHWEGVFALALYMLMAVLAMQCCSGVDYDESDDEEPPSGMYR